MSDDMTGTGESRTRPGDREAADELPTFSPSGAGDTVLTAAEVGQVVAALEASRSPATRRAYATAWRQWCEWTAGRAARPMPAIAGDELYVPVGMAQPPQLLKFELPG